MAISARGAVSSRSRGAWFPAGPTRFVRLDFIVFPQRNAYIVEPFEKSPGGVIVNVERHHDRSRDDVPILKIHSDFQTGLLLDQLPQQFHIILRNFCRQQPRLARIPAKNVAES